MKQEIMGILIKIKCLLQKTFCSSMINRLENGEIEGMETVEEDTALCPEEKG